MKNAGKDAGEYMHQVGKGKGFDAREEEVVDMIASGIMDPVKVTRSAVENASSVAAMLLTTEAVIFDEPKSDDGRWCQRTRRHGRRNARNGDDVEFSPFHGGKEKLRDQRAILIPSKN